MFKKIILFSFLYFSGVQANGRTNVAPHIIYTTTTCLARTAGSYILYQVLNKMVDTLELQGEISKTEANKLRIILKIKACTLPLLGLLHDYLHPITPPPGFTWKAAKQVFFYSTGLFNAERELITKILSFF